MACIGFYLAENLEKGKISSVTQKKVIAQKNQEKRGKRGTFPSNSRFYKCSHFYQS